MASDIDCSQDDIFVIVNLLDKEQGVRVDKKILTHGKQWFVDPLDLQMRAMQASESQIETAKSFVRDNVPGSIYANTPA